jgi:polyvinyl alcohol dehydrogenase (cytochrome)
VFALNGTAHGAAMNGETVYTQRCAVCHDNAVERTPPRAQIARLSPEDIVASLTKGVMQVQASGLGEEEMRNVATYVAGRPFSAAVASEAKANKCAKPAPAIDLKAPSWMGWGNDIHNTRYQPNPGLSVQDIARLKPKWAFAYDGKSAIGQPSVIGDYLFVTQVSGRVTALDAKSGCEYWSFTAASNVRTAVSVAALPKSSQGNASYAAFFGTFNAIVHAVDAQTGRELWQTKVDDHAVARLTGAPVYSNGVLYVPVSSHEEPAAASEKYPCCTFRGAVVALDAFNGKMIWKGFGIPQAPKPLKVSSSGTQMFGPAGGAIWSAPTIDAKRGLVYAATGNSYTDADTEGGNDSIVAFDIKTGRRVWASQVTPKDSFLLGCPPGKEAKGNCPTEIGPDYDLGSSPILQSLPNGKQIIVAGQKSGVVYGLDPDQQGKVVWQTRVGKGSALGGVEWGHAVDLNNAYVPISDIGAAAGAAPGIYAVDLATGKLLWSVPTPTVTCSWDKGRCSRAQSAAASVIPGAVFSGAFDGHLRAYSTKDGAIIWDFDTAPARDTVNEGRVEGGTIDATGAVIANGMVYVASGYGTWGKTGRLLIAFSVDGK